MDSLGGETSRILQPPLFGYAEVLQVTGELSFVLLV